MARSDGRGRERKIVLGILVAFLGILLVGAILPGRVFFYRDHALIFRRLFYQVTESYAHFRWPLWDPSVGGGEPLAAYPNALAWSPLFSLFLLPGSFDAHYQLFVVAHLVIAGVGAYLLAREMRCRPLAGAFASVLFTASGFVLSLNCLIPAFASVTYGPLAIKFAVRLLFRPSKTTLALFALFLGLHVQTADPIFFVCDLALFLAAAASGLRASRAKALARGTVALAAGAALAFGVAAVQILPVLELLREGTRGKGFGYDVVSAMSIHPLRSFELFMPGLSGDFETFQTLFSTDLAGRRIYVSSIYLGASIFPLLAIASFVPRSRRWLVAATFCLVLALGAATPLHRWLIELVPPLRSSRFPVKLAYGVALGSAIAAAQVIHLVLISSARASRLRHAGQARAVGWLDFGPHRKLVVLTVVSAALFAVVALIWMNVGASFLEPYHDATVSDDAARAFVFRAARFGLLAALVGGLMLVACCSARARPELAVGAYLVVVSADLLIANRRLLATDDAEIFAPTPLESLIVADTPDPVLFVYGLFGGENAFTLPARVAVRAMNGRASPGSGVLVGIRYFFDPDLNQTRPRAWQDLFNHVGKLPRERLRLAVLRRLGVTHLSMDQEVSWPGITRLGSASLEGGSSVVVQRLEGTRRRFTWVTAVREVPDLEAAFSTMTSTLSLDATVMTSDDLATLRSRAPEVSEALVTGIRRASTATLTVERADPGALGLSISASGPGLIVMAQTLRPGWIFEVEGADGRARAVEPVRVDGVLTGLPIEPGTRSLRASYAPPSFTTGGIVSAFSLLVVVLLAAAGVVSRRSSKP